MPSSYIQHLGWTHPPVWLYLIFLWTWFRWPQSALFLRVLLFSYFVQVLFSPYIWFFREQREICWRRAGFLSNLFTILCRSPAWGTPPMAKVMRKEAWHTQRRDQASGNPLFPSIYPKARVCFMLSPTPLSLWGTLPHNRFSLRRSKRAAPRQ